MSDPVGNELVQVIGVSSTRAAASTTEFFTTQQIANLGGNASGPVRTITSGTTDSSLQTDGLIQWLSSSKSSKTQVINAGTVNGQTLEINDGTGNASQYPITLVGTGSITIVGNPGTNTLTSQLTGLTNHSLLVGAGTPTITSLGVAMNGQLPIGSAGANPVLANITSSGGTITVNNGPGTIDLEIAQSVNHTVTTTDATPTTIISFSLGATPGVYTFMGSLAAYNTTDTTGGSYTFAAGTRTSGTELGVEYKDEFEDTGMVSSDFNIITSANSLVIQVVGLASKTIDWVCNLNYIFVS